MSRANIGASSSAGNCGRLSSNRRNASDGPVSDCRALKRPTGCRSAVVGGKQGRASAVPFNTAASFQARLCALWMAVLAPPALNGGMVWAESPTRKTRPLWNWSATCSYGCHGATSMTVHVDRLTDRFRQQLAATPCSELIGGLPVAGKVRGDEHAEVVAYRQKDAVYIRVLDLHGVAVAELRNELSPRRPKVDEHDVDRQSAVARGRYAERVADRAVHAVGGDEIVGAYRFRAPESRCRTDGGDTSVVLLERAQLGPIACLAVTAGGCGLSSIGSNALCGQYWPAGSGLSALEGLEHRVDVERLPFFGAVQRRLPEHARHDLRPPRAPRRPIPARAGSPGCGNSGCAPSDR